MTDGGSETIAARGRRSLDSLRSLGMSAAVIPSGARSAESRNLHSRSARALVWRTGRFLDSLRSLGMTNDSLRSLGMTGDSLRSLGMTNLVIPSEVEESRQLARDDSSCGLNAPHGVTRRPI